MLSTSVVLFLLGTYSVIISCSVGVALLLLSVVDVLKLELGLAPYSIAAGVGTLTLVVFIKKCRLTQRSMPDTNTDKKYEKLGSLQHSCSLCQENGQESIDPTGIVTIVDAGTQQTLDCKLLLHGEKPPEVSSKTLISYISVEVPSSNAHGSRPFRIERKTCTQGKLPLTISFHQPGMVCDNHPITDSAREEYMYHSEDRMCIVKIIDQDQQGDVKVRDRHGEVMMKAPSLLKYSGPLATARYHKLERLFTKLYLSPKHEQILDLSNIILERSVSPDIKVFALCWKALSEHVHKRYEPAEEVLKLAWEKATQLECENGLLLQGRVLRHLAFVQYGQRDDDRALCYLLQAKDRLSNAAPSNETAFTLHTEVLVKRRRLFSTPRSFSSEEYNTIEKEYDLLLQHAKYMEEYEKPVICSFHSVKASFHLRSALISDNLPPKEFWPSPDDLKKAEECLRRVSLDEMPDRVNFYAAQHYRTCCDLHIWKRQYAEAKDCLEKARKLYEQNNLYARIQYVDLRCKLIERLTTK